MVDNDAGSRRFLAEEQYFYREDFETFAGLIGAVEGYIAQWFKFARKALKRLREKTR